ncbi:MAG TPA: NADH-quinone oxidoreductase subunit NuoF [Flexilinea sp.]|nr:NADH-quinone oxidoreductase subunit NuoF [Flexilinea sp.]HPR70106.1 NADH-quinone oxidoreductase subunit NuoF [Flexilinea sp.]
MTAICSMVELVEKSKLYSHALSKQTLRISVCAGTGCIANGSKLVYEKFLETVKDNKDFVDIHMLTEESVSEGKTVVRTGCRGFCSKGPLVHIDPLNVLYTHVKPEDVQEIYDAALDGKIIERLVYHDPITNEAYPNAEESPFYKNQTSNILLHCGKINPESIKEYIADQGYFAISKVLTEMTPEQVNNIVSASGLRGRGGGGFPTGTKWNFARVQKADKKYIVCNGDEGDPGAFMNRSVLEGDPHRVVEGMMIAGYAIGADEGVFYVRAEYPLAIERLKIAIREAEENGLLGKNILGSGFNFKLSIREGAGAFVCGEETALLASVEGKRGIPRPRPPFPAVSGLYGKPTVINNVETLANLPRIILNGPEWFRSFGTEKSPGTKTFALTGKVRNTGLVEIPMGTTLRQLVFDIGGGIPNGKKFKAVQIGGPSGGCLPDSMLDNPLDYDSLQKAGAMIGSGGIVVMDEDNCIVEVAKFFMTFIQAESCGKCVACREGTKQMLYIMEKIVNDQATLEDLKLLEEIAHVIQDASLCALGKTAANPILSTLRYFRSEYLAHIVDHQCPAGVCNAFKKYQINPDLCKGCGACAKKCPVNAISGTIKSPFTIDSSICIRCGTCKDTCRFGAIEVR